MRVLALLFTAALWPVASAAALQPGELFAAARAGDADRVRQLVAAGVPVDAADKYGSTALIMAAANGHAEVARALLSLGADADHREGFYGSDPLGMAMFTGHPEVALLLLAHGADDRGGALGFALEQGNEELARAAVESGPLYASQLAELKAGAAELAPVFQEILAAAKSRPDPEPPAYSAADLKPYLGAFEGWDSDTRVEVSLEGDQLELRLGEGEPVALSAVGEKRFESAAGGIEASFWGRAGTVEGIVLERPGASPESLRRSVAEPVGTGAVAAERREWTVAEPTVDWPSFRGPNASGIGDGREALTEWNVATGEGVLWSATLAGLGNSSPVVWGDRVFVTTAVAEGMEQTIRTGLTGAGEGVTEAVPHSWRVLAFDKRTGQKRWDTEIARAVPASRRHFKATQANSTPATDGEHLVAIFPTAGVVCLDLDGKIRWRHDLGGLNAGAFNDPGIQWGFASSPILHGGKVIQQVDVHGGPYLVAWHLETGEEVWRTEREVAPSWSTPALLASERGEELVVNGSTIHGYDPATGKELWSLGPNSELVIAAPVVGEGVVYVSAGYPPVKPIYAVPAGVRGDLVVDPRDGDERLVWSHGIGGAYMPTPLLYRGVYYVVHHNGRLVAYDAASGAPIFKSRFSRGGTFTASPVAVNGTLYLPTEEGMLYVLRAGPVYQEIAVHDFGEPLMATPAVSEGVLFIRTPSKLIAIGQARPPA